MAWLQSAPKEMPDGRRAFLSRFLGEDRAREFEVEPGPLMWLIELWADAGHVRVEAGPMGLQLLGLGWTEIMAWITGAQEESLAPLYRRGIMQLSAAYAAESMAAREVESPAPYDPGRG